MENIALIILLLFGVSFLGVLSNRYKLPLPILLVLSGLLISLVPGLPVIELKPEVAFLIFLPPLLYAAAWNTSCITLKPREDRSAWLQLYWYCLLHS